MAVICFLGECHPALIGKDTPKGDFPLSYISTTLPGYGGNVLMFNEDTDGIFAIHRVYTLNPAERRIQRLKQADPSKRVITKGCINVMPEVYEKLVDCCANGRVEIRR